MHAPLLWVSAPFLVLELVQARDWAFAWLAGRSETYDPNQYQEFLLEQHIGRACEEIVEEERGQRQVGMKEAEFLRDYHDREAYQDKVAGRNSLEREEKTGRTGVDPSILSFETGICEVPARIEDVTIFLDMLGFLVGGIAAMAL